MRKGNFIISLRSFQGGIEYSEYDGICSPAYVILKSKIEINDYFFKYYLKTDRYILELNKKLEGIRDGKMISYGYFSEIKLPYPSLLEQKRIADLLSLIDKRLECQRKIIEGLTSFKSAVSKKIFSQELRFKNEEGKNFPKWEQKTLGDCLEYEQPTNYLVTSTEYQDAFEVPVVTAGKTFILGYTNETTGIFNENLPVIIFDDFTTATQFVTFPFKAKSSAMKILKAKNNVNIRFMYESMQMIKYEVGGHGRHWISVFAEMEVLIPCFAEQNQIATFLGSLDNKINLETAILQQFKLQKQYLLQQLFI